MNARPTATRWRSPPESCAGQVLLALGEAELVEQLIGSGGRLLLVPLVEVGHHQEVLAGGEEGHQVHALEHEADARRGGTR